MYVVLLFSFGRSRLEIGSGQKTKEENCKEEDEDINRSVVLRGRVVFHLDPGHDVTRSEGTRRAEAAVKLICWLSFIVTSPLAGTWTPPHATSQYVAGVCV